MPYYSNDGLTLHYTERGHGRPLVILPGNSASGRCHLGELDHFSYGYRTIAVDFRGTGRSRRLAGEWPADWWERCTDDIDALLTHLGEPRCTVMGCSGGGNLALLFAARYPHRVTGVIADSCAERYGAADLYSEVADRSESLIGRDEFWEFAHGRDWQDVVDADSRLLLSLADAGGSINAGTLDHITCPVLLTGSLRDDFIPDLGEQFLLMARQIPDCRTYLHGRGAHPFMWSEAAVFRSICRQFLRELGTVPARSGSARPEAVAI